LLVKRAGPGAGGGIHPILMAVRMGINGAVGFEKLLVGQSFFPIKIYVGK
jgi:hypothetical protein